MSLSIREGEISKSTDMFIDRDDALLENGMPEKRKMERKTHNYIKIDA